VSLDGDPAGGRPRLVLASTSPYRRALLERLGLAFEVRDPGVDEAPIQRAATDAEAMVRALAEAKARAVAATLDDAIVIGADQCAVIESDGGAQILGKPVTVEAAVAQLVELAGRTHTLLTAVCLVDTRSGVVSTELDVVRLTMRPLSIEALRRYVEAERPLDCAGGYRIEGLGVALFEGVEGVDPTGIVGLPLMRLAARLTELGLPVP
jgi:septum formation protein